MFFIELTSDYAKWATCSELQNFLCMRLKKVFHFSGQVYWLDLAHIRLVLRKLDFPHKSQVL